MGGREVSREKEIAVIEEVLERFGNAQVNLGSSAARRQIASDIISELERRIPGMMALGELTAIPSPYHSER